VVGGKGMMMVEREQQPGLGSGTGGGGEALIEDARSGWKGPETLGTPLAGRRPVMGSGCQGGLRTRP
jgi:hypothetical protein